jgi:hypothetical protein
MVADKPLSVRDKRFSFRKIMKLKTICVGETFANTTNNPVDESSFPLNVLQHTSDFEFDHIPDFPSALKVVRADQEIDLIFIDADAHELTSVTMFVTQLREIRPRLPLIVFSDQTDDVMRYLLRSGATWHYLKSASQLDNLAEDINTHIFLPVRWEDVFEYYALETVKPRIEPGIGLGDLEALRHNPEELYIIKRLFANSDVVQVFRMDEGFSGSRIYTVKPRHQLKRILKIGTIDTMEAVQEKQETLIQPRLFRQVGQIRGKVVGGQHLAGACYSLAGSSQDAMTLSQFLQDHNRVRRELLDKILHQLQDSLKELYNGSAETELRYWAPLYSRVLPPSLVIESAVWAEDNELESKFVLDADDLKTISAIPNNQVLNDIYWAVRNDEHPEVLLRGFEVAEVNSQEGLLYLQDTLVEQYPADPLLQGKEHPILRFKIHLQPSQHDLLNHPVFRRGKKVAIRGLVSDTQETILARQIGDITGYDYEFGADFFELVSANFLSPLENLRFLLWEVGREDMIVPSPLVAPVLHGDLNAGNILVEANSDVPLWLIDFSDARAGHVYFDLAKLEVEFRTHVFYKLFHEMVIEKFWDADTTTKFILLVENLLLRHADSTFEAFTASLRDYQSDWYDDLYSQFPLYFENLLYFLYSVRQVARTVDPERFRQHYSVAVFFQSMAVLKYKNLMDQSEKLWARRLALCCALVHGKEAVAQSKRPQDITRLLGHLRQRSALALITVGKDEDRKYLMQWNKNWGRFNLVGGRINNQQGDRDSFARAVQRKLFEELGIRSPKDYHIVRERRPVVRQQFSRRQHIFKDYEFRVFEIELLPRHPRNDEEFSHFEQRFLSGAENVLLTPAEINHLRTITGRPVSETTRIVLQVVGEIESKSMQDQPTTLAFHLDELRPLVTRGRAKISGSLVNTGFGKLIENILVEVLPRPGYALEPQSAMFHIPQLDAGYDYPLDIGVQPREQDTKLTLRITYYDTRGNEFQQIIEHPIQFRTQVFSLFQLDNPYIVGKALSAGNEAMFIGRENIFTWIASSLLGQGKTNSLIITGQPRVGKTSLLLQLTNGSLGKEIRSHAASLFLPIYLNMQELDVRHDGELFSRLSQIISRTLKNRGIVVPAPEIWPTNSQGYRLFDQYLDAVESVLPEDGKLILILDEIDHLRFLIEEGWISLDLLAYLRSLMQHRSRIALVLGGTNRLTEEFWTLLYNAAESRELGPLTKRQTEQLIREPAQPQINFDDLVVERIWRLSGGHPYLTQLICNRLLSEINSDDSHPTQIGQTHLNKIMDALLKEDDGYLLALWENSSEDGKRLLAAAAACVRESGLPFSSGDIAARLGFDQDHQPTILNEHLEELNSRRLLLRVPKTLDLPGKKNNGNHAPQDPSDGDKYLFAFDLLRLWLLENHAYNEESSALISSPF